MYISIPVFILLFLVAPELAVLLGIILLICNYPAILLIGFCLWLALILLALLLKGISSFSEAFKIEEHVEFIFKKIDNALDKISDPKFYLTVAILFWVILFLSCILY